MTILIVEDDAGVIRYLRQALTEAGYDTEVVQDGQLAYQRASTGLFDLILLDIMLPNLGGLAICRRLRSTGFTTPILMITAKDTIEDKIEGLDSGADDYLIKPFNMAELLARTRALLRRQPAASPSLLQVGDLLLDTTSRQAFRAGKPVSLSGTEFILLEVLMRHAGQTLPRTTILDYVWQYDFDGHDNILDVYISYLRRKIDRSSEPSLIQTVRGIGYKLESHAAH